MRVVLGSSSLNQPLYGAVTIGVFDGLHIGHQQLIQRTIQVAQKNHIPSILYTFDPHPLSLLKPDLNIRRLFPIESMMQEASHLGLDYFIVENFSKAFSKISSEEFFNQCIYQMLKPSFVMIGKDFRFGSGREGGIQDLQSWTKRYSFQLEVMSPVLFKGDVVSTSLVRKTLHQVNFSLLQSLLGRHFSFTGVVVSGKKRNTGYPTANVESRSVLPKNGVYTCRMRIANQSFNQLPHPWPDQWHCGVMNIGLCPTFDSTTVIPQAEVHLLFGDSYHLLGQSVEIQPVHYLREEKKFNNSSDLTRQIAQDVKQAKAYFSK